MGRSASNVSGYSGYSDAYDTGYGRRRGYRGRRRALRFLYLFLFLIMFLILIVALFFWVRPFGAYGPRRYLADPTVWPPLVGPLYGPSELREAAAAWGQLALDLLL